MTRQQGALHWTQIGIGVGLFLMSAVGSYALASPALPPSHEFLASVIFWAGAAVTTTFVIIGLVRNILRRKHRAP